jgi:hypothetical protein
VDLVEDHDASLIRTLASRALRQGGVLGQIPTPLDEVTAAANLAPPEPLWDGNVAELPSGLQRVVRKLRGVVLGAAALRERTIYLDRSLSEPKQRFNHGHELGHSLLPWHRAAYHGDDRFTLAPETHEQLEQEASRFAAELLFQLDGFTNMAADYRLSLAVPLALSEQWATSRHATIRRYAETHHRPCALLVLGRYLVRSGGESALKVLWAGESPSFRSRHGRAADCLPARLPLAQWEVARVGWDLVQGPSTEPVLDGRLTLVDCNRGPVELDYHLFFNIYQLFVLVFPRPGLLSGTRVRATWRTAKSAS